MGFPTIEEICCKLDQLELSGAGECDGSLLLFAADLEKAEMNLTREFGVPGQHSWIEFLRQGEFEAVPPQSKRRTAEVDTKASVPYLQAGDEVGPSSSASTGTLGGIVLDSSGNPYLLGAWHSTPGQNVYEADSRMVVAASAIQIGSLNRAGGSTDCALALITDGTVSADLKFGSGYFEPRPDTARWGEDVELCGAITMRRTKGKVLCPQFHCALVKICGEFYKFNDQILIFSDDTFGDLGDSGGIVLRDEHSTVTALGLFFATSQDFRFSLAHPLTNIFAQIRQQIGFEPSF